MNCTKCNNEAIENQAMGKSFWYCRACKDEVIVDLEWKEYPVQEYSSTLNNNVILNTSSSDSVELFKEIYGNQGD